MKSNQGAMMSWAGPSALLAAAGAAGMWLWLTHGASVTPWLAVALLALGAAWLYRARSARRLFAAWDAYAALEQARAERRRLRPVVVRDELTAGKKSGRSRD